MQTQAANTANYLLQIVSVGSIITSVIICLISIYINRQFNKFDKHTKNQREENMLIIQSLYDIGALAHATGLAVQRGVCNGEMEKALTSYCKTEDDLTNFLIKRNADKR